MVSPPSSVFRRNPHGEVCDSLAELVVVAHLRSSLTPGPLRDCKLETPLRKRRSRVSITNEFSVKRQRVSEAIGSIDVSTDAEQRQEYADINAEPRVSFMSLSVLLPKLTKLGLLDCLHSLDCHKRVASPSSPLSKPFMTHHFIIQRNFACPSPVTLLHLGRSLHCHTSRNLVPYEYHTTHQSDGKNIWSRG